MSSERHADQTLTDWTITAYYFPATTEYRTLTDKSSPILTFRLLPASAGGGLLLLNNERFNPDGIPKQAEKTLLLAVATDDLGASIAFTKLSGITTSVTATATPSLNSGIPNVTSMTNIPTLPFGVVTTPAIPRSLVTVVTRASTNFASATSSWASTKTIGPDTSSSRKSAKLSGGAIAGVTIAVIGIVGILILSSLKQKARGPSGKNGFLRNLSFKRVSDKIVVSSHDDIEHNSSYPIRSPGPLEIAYIQNVASSQSHGPIAGAHELRADPEMNELPPRSPVEISPLSPIGYIVHRESAPNIDTAIYDASPHVEAQRKRELEWLEKEEAKIRQRREQLLQQAEEHRLSSEGTR